MNEIGQSKKAPQASTSYPCHEEARPFPQMAPSPPPSSRPNSTSPFQSRDTSRERDVSANFADRESIESSPPGGSGVHPGEGGIFNFSPSGPVTLTNLTPISPTNEDVYSSAELRSNPQPPISVLSPSRGYPYLFTGHGPPLFSSMQENEKYKKLMLKKQKRVSKKEKNVLNVFKAEDIEGHKGEEDLNSVLQSMGEKVEEKKVKVKKPREKIEKSKGEKRERSRRSVEKELEDQDDDEDVEDMKKQEEENLKPVNNIRNKFVDDDLVAFKNNFYLVTPEPGPLARHKSRDCLAGSAESLPGLNTSPSMSFTKVTSKKHRTKRTKDETGKPPPGPPAPDGRRAGYALRSRDTHSVSMSREQTCSPTESIVSQGEQNIVSKQSVEREIQPAGLDSQNFPKLVQDDFPALPGGGDSQVPVLASAWNRGVARASDNIVTIENSVTKEAEEEEVFVNDVTGNSKEENNKDTKANEASDVEAVIHCDVPSDTTDQKSQVNDINDSVGESEEKDSSEVEEETVTKTDIYADLTNFPDEGEVDLDKDDASVIDNLENFEVVTSEDEFNKRKADNSAAVVIFSEADQDWGSEEFTFGFDVNEDLVANTNTVTMVEASSHPQQMWGMPGSMGPLTPIDTVDGAILSFGGPDPMRMIVPVAVGVPVPVNNLGELGEHLPPLPFYPHHQFPNGAVIPPFRTYGLPYGHQLPPQGVHPVHHQYHGEEPELDAEKDVDDNAGEDQTISPESGISSASPLSWQPDSSPSLPAPGSYPHPRDTGRGVPAPLPLVSQVSQSLSNWQGHSVHDSSDSDRSSPAPGWATQVEFEEFRVAEADDATKERSDKTNDSGLASENSLLEKDLKDSKLEKFNLGEIVNFISSSWSSVSQDSSVSVYSAGSHSHTNVVA